MMRSLRSFLIGILAFTAVSLWATPVYANAPAPPSYAWFNFEGRSSHTAIQGVQLAECRTLQCSQPILLMQSGICTDAACLKSPPILSAPHRFDCVGDRCLFVEPSYTQRSTGPYYKLLAQFGDRVRISEGVALQIKNSLSGYSARNLRVIVREADLAIVPDTTLMKPSRWEMFNKALLLTELSELAVAAVWLWRMKLDKQQLAKALVAIAFVNLLTFPVVWFFFPSLQPFQYSTSRVFGVIILGIASLFGTLLATRSIVTLKTLRNIFVGWLISLPIALGIGFFLAIAVGYGESLPPVNGIPSLITLPVSEVFAVVFEAWLIYRLNDAIPLREASLLSLTMNLISMILGLLLLPAIQLS